MVIIQNNNNRKAYFNFIETIEVRESSEILFFIVNVIVFVIYAQNFLTFYNVIFDDPAMLWYVE